MMGSIVLTAAVKRLLPVQILFSWFLLLRGHAFPGGGFSGGLLAAEALALYAIAEGPRACRARLRVDPPVLMALGLALALAGGAVSLWYGEPFLSHPWHLAVPVPLLGELSLGTALVFDIGVYLVVVGASLGFLLNLQEIR